MKASQFIRGLACAGTLGVMGFAQAQLSGAIYTTLENGSAVNHNIYKKLEDVYLNGGPRNDNAPGLLDGLYFFQVTDPSGKVLLSTTSAWDRVVQVKGGNIVRRWNIATGTPYEPPVKGGAMPHPYGTLGSNANNQTPFRLFPYNKTPNKGDEYKAWVMLWRLADPTVTSPVNDSGYLPFEYSTVNPLNTKYVRYSLRWTKTDNFKIKRNGPTPPWNVVVSKYYDTNMNGQRDPEEFPITNFLIDVTLGSLQEVRPTPPPSGRFDLIDVPNQTPYNICEIFPKENPPANDPYVTYPIANPSPYWIQTAPGFSTLGDECYVGVLTGHLEAAFGNIATAKLKGVKFYDKDNDGAWDEATEPGLAGFTVKITWTWPDGIATGVDTVVTGANGVWESPRYPEGTTYEVEETVPDGWWQTSPLNLIHTGTIKGGVLNGAIPPGGIVDVSYTVPNVENLNFGNVRVCPLSGVKFYDRDTDGVKDAGEPGVAGISIHVDLTLPDGTETSEDLVTNADGSWKTVNEYPEGTTYEITETLPTSPGCWIQTAPAGGKYSGTLTGTGNPTDSTYELDCDGFNFGNILGARLCGKKVYDADADGVVDPEDPGIQGFKITIKVTWPNGDVQPTETVYTGPGGTYCTVKCYPEGSTYEVCEVAPSSAWKQTYPANDECYEGTIPASAGPYDSSSSLPDIEGLVFANVVVGPGGGHTPGYWHNQNGEETMMDGGTLQPELNALNALPLRNEDGSNADFANFQEFSDWLVSTNGVNMANKLSSHVAAMFLNIEAGFVNAGSYIYAPGTTSAGPLGFAEIGDVLAEAIAALAADGYTPSDDEPMRSYQTALKDALDKANNNTNWVSGPITVIPSPY